MGFDELWSVARAVIDTIESDSSSLSNESLLKLFTIFPQNVLLAALDLVDTKGVTEHITPWGDSQYEVRGSTKNYEVLLDITVARIPFSCTCLAFMNYVLGDSSHIMCKHILATLLARKLSASTRQPITAEELASLLQRHFLSETPKDDTMDNPFL